MAKKEKYYWMSMGIDFFKDPKMIKLQSMENGYVYSDILIKMYLKTFKNDFILKSKLDLSLVECVVVLTRHTKDDVSSAFIAFSKLGYIEMLNEKSVKFILRKTNRDVSSYQYKEWRTSVYKRDSYTCQSCGCVGVKLNAHHIVRWVDDESKRYDIDNGITLCVACHKLAHKAVK